MTDLIERATRATMRAVRNKAAPPDDGRACVWEFADGDGVFWAGVFDARRFAMHNPERFANWILGLDTGKLEPPRQSDREAIGLLPERLQRKIRKSEKVA